MLRCALLALALAVALSACTTRATATSDAAMDATTDGSAPELNRALYSRGCPPVIGTCTFKTDAACPPRPPVDRSSCTVQNLVCTYCKRSFDGTALHAECGDLRWRDRYRVCQTARADADASGGE